jgi:hypothetical protein
MLNERPNESRDRAECPHNFTMFYEREPARDMKEELSYVALDFDAEMQTSAADLSATYTLPDGNDVVLWTERFCCPELLFGPYLSRFESHARSRAILEAAMGNGEADGIHQLLFKSIEKYDLTLRVVHGNVKRIGFPANERNRETLDPTPMTIFHAKNPQQEQKP